MSAGTGMAHIACAVAMFEDSSDALDQVRFVNTYSYPEGDHAIKFETPCPPDLRGVPGRTVVP